MAAESDLPQRDESDAAHLAFTVDTHLLRELGALLVGRNSTAVVELIKNAYDADATRVVVHGEELNGNGSISITDDGHGMTERDFQDNFLRIAGRSKEGGSRRSPSFQRRFTGAKGIGRLSAHKLGSALRVESSPKRNVLSRTSEDRGFDAYIDWQAIEESSASIENTRQITLTAHSQGDNEVFGTSFSITRLHGGWPTRELNSFLREVRSTRPDSALIQRVSEELFPGTPLIPEIRMSDSLNPDPGFVVELSGEFAGTESQWPTLLSHTNWMIEIDARGPAVRYRMTPSALTRSQNSAAETRDFTRPREAHAPEFVARIFVRDGSTRGNAMPDLLDRFAKEAAGIRVYSEGFRVLPYGGPRNDWLGIDADYTQRATVDVDEGDLARPSGDERVYVRPGSAYFGGVFLLDATRRLDPAEPESWVKFQAASRDWSMSWSTAWW